MRWPADLVARVHAEPETTRGWTAAEWSRLFQQARMSGLLARIAERLGTAGDAAAGPWPAAAAAHVESAWRVCRAQHDEIRREVHHIRKALAGVRTPVVLLKGAAYVMAGLPAAQGRVFSDVDILVPKANIAEVESRLMIAGWMTTHHSAYDQRYYRQWMHEIPPLQHVQRQTTLDVHHTIVPETARLRPDARKLFAAARPLEDGSGLFVLAPTDMVLHSMTHLFLNDDMSHALRDLSDLDALLRHFGRDPSFWPALRARAAELDLRRPLYYGLRYTRELLCTPGPAPADVALSGPSPPLRILMDAIWRRALRSPHPSAAPAVRGLALFALYVRGHWLRMPPLMLARHLAIKALRRSEGPGRSASANDPR